MVTDVDYLIIGAGLSGLTLQHFLTAGSVAVVDPHPGRYRLGESIVPEHFRDPALAGLVEEVQRLPSISPKRGSLYIGEDSVAAFPLPPLDYPLAMHLRREELEACMARRWRTPVEHERVVGVEPEARLVHTDRRTWRVGRQIIDCSGVARVLARSMNLDQELWQSFSSWMYLDIRRVDDDRFAPFLAETGRAYARFDPGVGHRLPAEEYPGWSPSSCTIVRKVRDGMFAWQIPLYGKSVLSFGVTSRHGPISRDDLLAIARTCVAPCFVVSPRPFDGSSQYNRFHVHNRFSHQATTFASRDWILVGDAGFFGEPIYATGTAVAVNQALFVARALNDGGWSPAKERDYTARTQRLVDTSRQARRSFFDPAHAAPAGDGRFADRGLEGTRFQLTMANNYGLILAGLKLFSPDADGFASRHESTPEEHERCAATVGALVFRDPDGTLAGWQLRAAYRASGGLQLSCARPGLPDLTLHVEPQLPERRYFRGAGPFGVAYLSLPDRAYPLGPEALALVDVLCSSLEAWPAEWSTFLAAA